MPVTTLMLSKSIMSVNPAGSITSRIGSNASLLSSMTSKTKRKKSQLSQMTTGDNSEHAVLGVPGPAIAGLIEEGTWAGEPSTDLEEEPPLSAAPLPSEPSTDPESTSLAALPSVTPTLLVFTSTLETSSEAPSVL